MSTDVASGARRLPFKSVGNSGKRAFQKQKQKQQQKHGAKLDSGSDTSNLINLDATTKQPTATLDFQKVCINQKKVIKIRFANTYRYLLFAFLFIPLFSTYLFTHLVHNSTRVRLVVRKQPSRYGFSVFGANDGGAKQQKSKCKSHVIDAGVSCEISVAWTPPKVGNYRHIIVFQALLQTHTSHGTPKFAKNGVLCTVTVQGHAVKESEPTTTTKIQAKNSTRKCNVRKVTSRNLKQQSANKQMGKVARPQRRPKPKSVPALQKKFEHSKRKVPMIRPTKGKQMFDSKWMDKQELGFVTWANDCLKSSTSKDKRKLKQSTNPVASPLPKGQNPGALGVLVQKREEANLRRKAFAFFHSAEMEEMKLLLDNEIASGRMSVRSDRNLSRDVSLRGFLLKLVFSYRTQWLRIGLETVFGEIICRDENTSLLKTLKTFVLQRLLSNAELKEKYKRKVAGLHDGSFACALGNEITRKFLLLVRYIVSCAKVWSSDRRACIDPSKLSLFCHRFTFWIMLGGSDSSLHNYACFNLNLSSRRALN